MRFFTPEWFEGGCPPVPEYEEYLEGIRLPAAIDEHFSLHDAQVVRIAYIEKSHGRGVVHLFLDTRHSTTKAKEVVFTGARLLLEGAVEGSWWIGEEFDVVQDGYRMDAMTVDGKTDTYSFLTIAFRDMVFR